MTDQNETETTPPEPNAGASAEPTPEPAPEPATPEPEPEPTPEPEVVADASGAEDSSVAEDAQSDPATEPALTDEEIIEQGAQRTKQMCDDYMSAHKAGQESSQDEQPE